METEEQTLTNEIINTDIIVEREIDGTLTNKTIEAASTPVVEPSAPPAPAYSAEERLSMAIVAIETVLAHSRRNLVMTDDVVNNLKAALLLIK